MIGRGKRRNLRALIACSARACGRKMIGQGTRASVSDFMFRKRSIILGMVLLFFLTANLTAYIHCVEISDSFDNSEIESAHNHESHSDSKFLHCPNNLESYLAGNSTDRVKQHSKINQPAKRSSVNLPQFTTELAPRTLPPSLLSAYRIVPLYQFKMVYRI